MTRKTASCEEVGQLQGEDGLCASGLCATGGGGGEDWKGGRVLERNFMMARYLGRALSSISLSL